MKILALIILACTFSFVSQAQNKSLRSTPDPEKKLMIVDASCGECQFNMTGKGCNLAVRFDGKSYYVDGTTIDQHGDAHAKDGFCQAIRKAEVQGDTLNGRFVASYFKLKSVKEKEKDKDKH